MAGPAGLLQNISNQLQALQQAFLREQLESASPSAPSAELQHGAGDEDLTTAFPEPESISSPVVENANALLDGSESERHESERAESESDDIDDELLLTVTPHLRQKAKVLLTKLKEHADVLRFEKDGTIFIDDAPLSDANIFKLFPLLFKPAHYSSHPNLQTLVNEIATIGLGHLMSRYYSAGLSPRGKNFIPNRKQLRSELKKPFWYKLSNE